MTKDRCLLIVVECVPLRYLSRAVNNNDHLKLFKL